MVFLREGIAHRWILPSGGASSVVCCKTKKKFTMPYGCVSVSAVQLQRVGSAINGATQYSLIYANYA